MGDSEFDACLQAKQEEINKKNRRAVKPKTTR